jgi:CRISPR-associated protein Cmr6
MAIALYKDDTHPKDIKAGEHGGNAGLFWGKFFDGYSRDFTDFADKETSKRDFLRKFTGSRGDGSAINAAALRQIALTESLGGVWFVATNHDASPFVTGTGNSHPVENGFLWHHTLSAPYMQGSAVKGIMRSWLENQLGYSVKEDDNHSELKRYFGSETKESSDNQAGNLIFLDAIPIAPPRVKVEIMTPHLGDYYAKGIKEAGKANTIPADWHSPNPIPLLAVESISLLFCIAPRNGKIDAAELAQLSTALQNALTNMGAGAKTQTGFGRLLVNEKETNRLANSISESNQSELSKRAQNIKEKFISEGGQPNAASGNDIFKFLSELSLESLSKDEITDIRALMKTYKPSSKKDKEFKAIRNQFNAKFPE